MFKLPTDLLRIWKLTADSQNYEREGNYILTDDDVIMLRYIALVTDVSKFSKSFIDCLTTILAARLATDVANKPQISNRFLVELEQLRLPKAYRAGAIETDPKDNQEKTNPSKLTSWQAAGH